MIGYKHLKEHRLENPVSCHPGTTVGDYVPFYFCRRSPMLSAIHKRPDELGFKGGQEEIVYLVTTVGAVVDAAGEGRWAFSDRNAAVAYGVRFSADLDQLRGDAFVRWPHVRNDQWGYRDAHPDCKRFKQAEFLVRDGVPWSAFVGLAVHNPDVRKRAKAILAAAGEETGVAVRRGWYY